MMFSFFVGFFSIRLHLTKLRRLKVFPCRRLLLFFACDSSSLGVYVWWHSSPPTWVFKDFFLNDLNGPVMVFQAIFAELSGPSQLKPGNCAPRFFFSCLSPPYLGAFVSFSLFFACCDFWLVPSSPSDTFAPPVGWSFFSSLLGCIRSLLSSSPSLHPARLSSTVLGFSYLTEFLF